MPATNFHSLLVLPKEKSHTLLWIVRSFNSHYGHLRTHLINAPKKTYHLLNKHPIQRVFWFVEFEDSFEQAQNIHQTFPDLEWIVVTQKRQIQLIMHWQRTIKPKGIWHIADCLEFNFLEFVRPAYAVSHSPTIYKLLQYPFLALTPQDLRLLKTLQQGIPLKQIQKILQISKSTLYRRLDVLKDRFELSYRTDIELINKAKEQGYLE